MVLPSKLHNELIAAGVADVASVVSTGQVYDAEGVDISTRADVAAVIAVHDPTPEQPLTDAERITALEEALLMFILGGA